MRHLTLLTLLALGACSAPQSITLRDPQTKQVVECKSDPWAVWSWDQAAYNESCAKRYESAGFQRLK